MMLMIAMYNSKCNVFVYCEDYDDLEFSIVSLDGRQWLFEAATLEVSSIRLHCAISALQSLTF